MDAEKRPAPPVTADLDLRTFEYMPLHVQKLRDSDLAVLATGDEFRAAVLLWSAAWHQIPASSLPCDDRLLAKLAGYGRDVQGWLMVKEVALRGFIECGDGRLYHPIIAETALTSATKKRARQAQTEAATAARLERQRNETRNDKRNVHQENRIEEKDGGGDAPARTKPAAVVSREAIAIANELMVLAGHSLEFVPPGWCGAPMRVQAWMSADARWTREVMIAGAKAAMARKTDGAPSTVNYFEKPIARIVAQQSAPIQTAEAKAYEQDPANRPASSWRQSRDRFRQAHAQLAASVEADEAGGDGKGGDEEDARLIASPRCE